MTQTRILQPKAGHIFDLVVVGVILGIFVALAAYAAYELALGEARVAIQLYPALVLLLIPGIGLMFRPGRYLLIDHQAGISKPLLFKRSRIRLIPPSHLESYLRIRDVAAKDRTVGLIVRTKAGKQHRYTERRTPGSVSALEGFLSEHGVKEMQGARPLVG